MKSYRNLDIFNLSYNLAVEVHKISLTLPKYELFESGSQLRRSSKGITANIVEGYGRRRYKADFIKFLVYAHASCDETMIHLNFLNDIHNFEKNCIIPLLEAYEKLSKKISKFIQYVEKEWK